MPRLPLIGLAFLAIASGIGSCQNGWRDVGASLTRLAYPEIRDMRRTVAIIPQHKMMLPPPDGSIPTRGAVESRGLTGIELATLLGETLQNPLAADDSTVARGERQFRRVCTPCHGPTMAGEGPVTPSFMPPPDLLAETTRGRADGYIWSYIRNGGAVMPRYGPSVTAEEAWQIVHYVRHMQRMSPR
jgi:mono/diheme cytochrome c family protein